MKQGIIIIGHGTRNKDGKLAFLSMVQRFSARHPESEVKGGFLELQQPSPEEVFEDLRHKQITRIFVLPAFLFTGVHLRTDIPHIFRTLALKHPGIDVRMGSYIGLGHHLINMCIQAISQCETGYREELHEDTALLVVGVGASVNTANRDIAGLAELIGHKEGFGHVRHAFIGKMTGPYFTDGLKEVLTMGKKRIIVCPLLLFPGVYYETITEMVEEARKNTVTEILVTATIGDDGRLLEILDQRLEETISGTVDLIAELPDDAKPRRGFSNR